MASQTPRTTISGQQVDIGAPDPATIRVTDIAHHLARIGRFAGGTTGDAILSVAQHSLWVAYYLAAADGDIRMQRDGLLHDAAEAYLGDLPQPLKQIPAIQAAYAPIEDRLLSTIYTALAHPEPTASRVTHIKWADRQSAIAEAHARLPWPSGAPSISQPLDAVGRAVYAAWPFPPMAPVAAADAWLAAYRQLNHGIPLHLPPAIRTATR